jgi:hypothetical protein
MRLILKKYYFIYFLGVRVAPSSEKKKEIRARLLHRAHSGTYRGLAFSAVTPVKDPANASDDC